MLIRECIHLITELIREEYPNTKYEEQELDLFKRTTGEKLEKSKSLIDLDISEYDELVLG